MTPHRHRLSKPRATPAARKSSGRRARLTMVNDITGSQCADEASRYSEALLRSITDQSEHIIFVKDANLRFVFMNPAGYRLTGLRPQRLIGRTDAECHLNGAESAA